ncbi:MBL fold metallo-hydrolase [Egicoccus halophilus]|uniref:MBL fold metallo-hydrolase n=1 Tax=Egicoccus halophilus TaxID=1670830 RepID=A0A8J3ESH2_9ACTN|nr:MBL fold metallo-hydrolase [Egicoccus halophilus]GGI02685.1 MBL fold metallo-hydrolase [Egicoccus halophilus]
MSPSAAPVDPRSAWDLPAFGELPRVSRLDEVTTRVLAPNPSPMTLDGTNTYVVGRAGTGGVVVVDPGPDDPEHLARVRQVVEQADASVVAILVTHHHLDHAEAAQAWAQAFGSTVVAAATQVAGPQGRTLADGDVLDPGDLPLRLVATPGHTRDHLAVRVPTGAMLTGDHVLGRGTSVVAHPDGDLAAYLTSLRRVLDLGPDRLFPGHGPALSEDPTAVLRYYAEHRAFRRQQILEALAEAPTDPAGLVRRIYADVDPRLWPAAEASTRAALHLLADEGRIDLDGATVRLAE